MQNSLQNFNTVFSYEGKTTEEKLQALQQLAHQKNINVQTLALLKIYIENNEKLSIIKSQYTSERA